MYSYTFLKKNQSPVLASCCENTFSLFWIVFSLTWVFLLTVHRRLVNLNIEVIHLRAAKQFRGYSVKAYCLLHFHFILLCSCSVPLLCSLSLSVSGWNPDSLASHSSHSSMFFSWTFSPTETDVTRSTNVAVSMNSLSSSQIFWWTFVWILGKRFFHD